MGWVGFAGLEFYDPNPTRHAIKKNFVTQPNPLSPKNQLNPAGWVGLGRVGSGQFWWVDGLAAHPYLLGRPCPISSPFQRTSWQERAGGLGWRGMFFFP